MGSMNVSESASKPATWKLTKTGCEIIPAENTAASLWLRRSRHWEQDRTKISYDETARLAKGTENIQNWVEQTCSSAERLTELALRLGPKYEFPAVAREYEEAAHNLDLRCKYGDIAEEQKTILQVFQQLAEGNLPTKQELANINEVAFGMVDLNKPNGLTKAGTQRYRSNKAIINASEELEESRVLSGVERCADRIERGTDAIWRQYPEHQEIELRAGYGAKCGNAQFVERIQLPHEKTGLGNLVIKTPKGTTGLKEGINNIHALIEILHELDKTTPDFNWDPQQNQLAKELRAKTNNPQKQRTLVKFKQGSQDVIYMTNTNTVILPSTEGEDRIPPDCAPKGLLEQLNKEAERAPNSSEIELLTQITIARSKRYDSALHLSR